MNLLQNRCTLVRTIYKTKYRQDFSYIVRILGAFKPVIAVVISVVKTLLPIR